MLINNNRLALMLNEYVSSHMDKNRHVDWYAVLQDQKKRISNIQFSSIDRLSEKERYDLLLSEVLEEKCIRDYMAYATPIDCWKPASIEELLSKSKIVKDLSESAWRTNYPGLVKSYIHNERIGFDRCTFAFVPGRVDEEWFYHQIDFLRSFSEPIEIPYSKWGFLPTVEVIPIDPDRPEEAVRLPGLKTPKYREIKIKYSPYVEVELRHNNIGRKDEPKGDVFLIKIRVTPASGYWELGNLRNYSIDDLKSVVFGAVYDSLAQDFNLLIYEVTFRRMEVNLTIDVPGTFKELVRILSYYQGFMREGYTHGVYKHKGVQLAHNKSKVKKYSKMFENGLTSKCASLKITLYDKAFETATSFAVKKSKSTLYDKVLLEALKKGYKVNPYRLEFEKYSDNSDHCLMRTEFSIKKESEIKAYFGRDWDLKIDSITQSRLENGWKSLVNAFLVDTYKDYYFEARNGLTDIIRKMNTSNRKWREELIRDVLHQEITSSVTPYLLTNKDIEGIVKASKHPLFSQHPARYTKDIEQTLCDSDLFPKEPHSVYEIMATYFMRTYELKDLNDVQMIVYAIGCNPDDNPKLSKKLEHMMVEKKEIEDVIEHFGK